MVYYKYTATCSIFKRPIQVIPKMSDLIWRIDVNVHLRPRIRYETKTCPIARTKNAQ